MIDTLVRMYGEGAITRYQIMIDCLHMVDPQHPELVLEGLPAEVHDEMLDYSSRYDPHKRAPKERIMPALDQVEAAVAWIKQKRSGDHRWGQLSSKL